jgi:hypothetical protein
MGEVYVARDVRLDRRVAIKILPAELSSNDFGLAKSAPSEAASRRRDTISTTLTGRGAGTPRDSIDMVSRPRSRGASHDPLSSARSVW